jgi:uroporphyrinogen-III synthase
MSALAGRRVAVTRAAAQADELVALLESAGAEPLRCPTIRIAPPASYAQMDAALARLDTFDWLVFTSANGVRAVFERAAALAVAPSLLSARVAVVGRVTGQALAERGVSAAFIPPQESAQALGDMLPDVATRAVLLAQGESADALLASTLAGRGAHVTALTTYRTVPMAPSGEGLEELRKGVDALTFTSPSTVEGFVALGAEWRSIARRAIVVTIGPTTTDAALARGLGVHAEARERTMSALVEAVAGVLGKGSPSAGTVR